MVVVVFVSEPKFSRGRKNSKDMRICQFESYWVSAWLDASLECLSMCSFTQILRPCLITVWTGVLELYK